MRSTKLLLVVVLASAGGGYLVGRSGSHRPLGPAIRDLAGADTTPARPVRISGASAWIQPKLASSLAAPSAPAPASADSPIHFTRLQLDTSSAGLQACLFFSRALSTAVTGHFEDYVHVDPAANVALRPRGNALCLGGLSAEAHYAVTVAAGLPAAAGPASIAAETVAVSFGEVPPTIDFVGSGTILSRDQAHGLPIATVNMDRVRVSVTRVGDRILARTALGQDEDGEAMQNIAVPVWTGELAVRQQLNARVVTSFPLGEVLTPRRAGAYMISITGLKDTKKSLKGHEAAMQEIGSATRWVFDTDLMLTSLTGQDGVHVFVRSLKTALPAAGAAIDLLAANNDVLAEVKTGADGQAVFGHGLVSGTGALAPRMLMAYLGDDFTAMAMDRPSLDLSAQDVAGREEPGPVDAFLYTDRGIYRPGETVDAVALIRDASGHALKPTPIALVLRRPDGVEAGRWRAVPDAAGGVFQPITLSPAAPRGTWTLDARLAGDDGNLGSQPIEVQDFVPQRLKVALQAATPAIDILTGGSVDVAARYLFGAPAQGLAVQARLSFTPDSNPVGDPSWSFGLVDQALQSAPQDLTIAATDAQGHAAIRIDPATLAFPASTAPYEASLAVSVVEPGGRTTDQQIDVPVRVGRRIGLRMVAATPTGSPSTQATDDQQSTTPRIEVAAFAGDGTRIAAPGLTYRLLEIIENYDYYQLDGKWQFGSHSRERVVALGPVAVAADKAAVVTAPPLDWGSYRLEIDGEDAKPVASISVYSGWTGSDEGEPAPEKLPMAAQGLPVLAGAVAHVHVTPPFAGEMLVTVVGGRVYQTRLIHMPAEGATIDIPVDGGWGTGAYVLASLYRPQQAAAGHAPIRAVGAVYLPLDLRHRVLQVAIAPPAVARPRTHLVLPVSVTGAEAGEPVYVTVAAVDEGLLQLTHFASPDPAAHYFAKRRLAVDMRDDYGHLIDGRAGEPGAIRQGGDAGGGAGLSVVPTRTVALFSGLVKLDADGRASIPFDMPDFSGGLRIMAVAYGTSGIGHAEAMMPLRDPVVADISLPRFLAPHDAGAMTLLLNNVEAPAGRYHVHIAASGALGAPVVDKDFQLAAGGQAISSFPVTGGAPGIGQVALLLSGPGRLSIARSWSIEIRSPHFPLTLGSVAMQARGETFTFDPKLVGAFQPGTLKLSVDYSTLRGIDLAGLVEALDRYPYGCSEQLVSTSMPLLYLSRLKLAAGSAAPETEHLKVQAAIDTLLPREDSDGSFGLWRLGDQEATPFLGAYITDFLFRAKAQGYAVSDEALNRAYSGISDFDANLASWNTLVFWRWDNGAQQRATVLAGQAYAAYDLARAGRADIGQVRYLADTFLQQLEPVGQAQLAAALAMLGDTPRAVHAFDAAETAVMQPTDYWARWSWYGDFYRSSLRDTALLLTLAAELGREDHVASLTAKLESQDTRTEVLNTQEQAWLAVAAATLLDRGGDLRISVNHAPPVQTRPPMTLSPDLPMLQAGYTVQNQGQAAVFRAMTLYGVPREAPPALGNVAAVTKSVTTLDGKPVNLAAIRQNDRLVVHLTGSIDDLAYHQMILVDMLPAGWEIDTVIESTDDANAGYDWLGKISPTKSMQKRDDRFFAALDLSGHGRNNTPSAEADDPPAWTFNLAYVVRCVTPGVFVLPAAVLQDMYRPPVMARSGVGTVTIAGVQ